MTKYFLNLLLSASHVSTKHLHPTLGKKERPKVKVLEPIKARVDPTVAPQSQTMRRE